MHVSLSKWVEYSASSEWWITHIVCENTLTNKEQDHQMW